MKFKIAIILLLAFFEACFLYFIHSPKHFLWKVSDSDSSVWVLGSIHFADTSFYPLDSVIEYAFESSEELAVEVDISNDSVVSDIQNEYEVLGTMEEGGRLQDQLPEDLWNSLDSLCLAWEISCEEFQPMKPWRVSMMLSVEAFQRTGFDNQLGIDSYFLERAQMENKTIVALETASEQITALADTSAPDENSGVLYLRNTLREISTLDSMMTRIARAWKTGDEDLLRKVMGDDDDAKNSAEENGAKENGAEAAEEAALEARLKENIFTTRNGKMAKSIAKMLEENRSVLVVIGAAHLVLDDDNVIELLKEMGYTVSRF